VNKFDDAIGKQQVYYIAEHQSVLQAGRCRVSSYTSRIWK